MLLTPHLEMGPRALTWLPTALYGFPQLQQRMGQIQRTYFLKGTMKYTLSFTTLTYYFGGSQNTFVEV